MASNDGVQGQLNSPAATVVCDSSDSVYAKVLAGQEALFVCADPWMMSLCAPCFGKWLC
jgi:hypothetical protein